MPFTAAISTAPEAKRALEDVCDQTVEKLSGPADLAMLFFSVHHLPAVDELARGLLTRLRPRCLLGCVADSVVGNGREVEQGPALSLWLGKWKSAVTADPFHIALEQTADGPSLLGWPDALESVDAERSAVLLLGDPFSFPTDFFLERINESRPGLRVIGGMASGVHKLGECRLIQNDTVLDRGAVGVVLQGDLGLRPIVSQGCRPIGRHMVITRVEDNLILELGGKPPLVQLQNLWDSLNPEEQNLFQRGLHIGRVINEYQEEFQRGDFLVRNVIGLDRESGAMAISDRVRVGQTVQFHVRDSETADEDLRELLQLDVHAHEKKPAAALLFSCNGRGTRLFDQPDHDASAVRDEVGEIPLAGFFAQGELGPVGGQNFIHGFTASLALFEE